MTDFDSMAAAMFGSTTPSNTPTNTRSVPTNTAESQMAETLFGETTKPTPHSTPNTWDKRPFNTLDEADQANRMFNDGADPALYHGDAMRSIESAAMEQFTSSPDEAKEASAYWGAHFQSFELTGTESAAVADIGVQAFTTPASPALVESWTEQARAVLVQDYGPTGAAQALADARTFVNAYATPELRDTLMATGLGNHPQLVRIAAAKARALRMAGKL